MTPSPQEPRPTSSAKHSGRYSGTSRSRRGQQASRFQTGSHAEGPCIPTPQSASRAYPAGEGGLDGPSLVDCMEAETAQTSGGLTHTHTRVRARARTPLLDFESEQLCILSRSCLTCLDDASSIFLRPVPVGALSIIQAEHSRLPVEFPTCWSHGRACWLQHQKQCVAVIEGWACHSSLQHESNLKGYGISKAKPALPGAIQFYHLHLPGHHLHCISRLIQRSAH